jgi:outer membrane receptor protein involved in Fe transport
VAVCEATFGAGLIGLDMARLSVLAITAVAIIAIPEAQAVDTSSNAAETEGVTVTGEATASLTSVSPEESAEQKRQVPGAFTVKTADDMELGRASNFEDLLQRTPGVFLQSENGDCRNLTNQRYASSIDPIADARTEPNPEIFHPGDGRSFYGGVSWSW